MSWESDPGARPPWNGNGNGNGKVIRGESVHLPFGVDSLEPAESETRSWRSSSLSPGGDASDDPRVIAALAAYLEDLQAGRRWSRDEFLARHPGIAETLSHYLTGLEFIH